MEKIYNNEIISKFICLQPIIDILTYFMISKFDIALSLGMVIRFIFLVYCFIYLLRIKDKKTYIYLGLLFLYIIISTTGNYIIKDNFNIISYLVFLSHFVYFPIVLLFFYKYFKNNKTLSLNVFSCISIIIGLTLILSLITNTSNCSYVVLNGCLKGGVLSWFNSANEMSVILSILLSLMILNHLKNGTIISYLTYIVIMTFLSIIGTKTSMLAIIIINIAYIFYYLITTIIDRNKFYLLKRVLLFVPIFLLVFVFLDKLPIYYNLIENYKYSNNNLVSDKEDLFEIVDNNNTINENSHAIETIEEKDLVKDQMIYNGRYSYLVINKKLYKEASTFNKIFGITNQGNIYEGNEYYRTNERDIHDLFIHYGIVGLIIVVIMPVIIGIKLIKYLFKNIKLLLDDEIFILILINSLVLAISYMAGHVLFQPAVSIYFAYLICYLYKKVEEKSCNKLES